MVDLVLTPLAVAGLGWLGKHLVDPALALASDVAPNLISSQVFDPLCLRLRGAAVRRIRAADGSLPRNHDIERAVRTAQLDADRVVVAAFADMARRRNRPSDAAFAREALAWIDGELGAIAKLSVSDPVLDRMVAALDAPMTSDADLDAARAIQAAFLELEAGAGGDAPDSFADLFRAGDGACPPWFEAFGDFLAEQIKTDERFRSVLTAARLAEIGAGVRRIEDLLAEREPVWTALHKATDDILAGLDRIEDKVDTLTAMVATMMAAHGGGAGDKAALLAEIDQLRTSGALTARAIEGFLKDVGETPLPPDQWPAQLAAFAERFRGLVAELARRTNLPAYLEAERTQALAAAETGDLKAAETILAALTDRLATWRRDQQELLYQGAREEALLLADRAAIARASLRYYDAADLYTQAEMITPTDDVESRWDFITKKAQVVTDFGREFGEKLALDQAISLYHNQALPLASREINPHNWAKTQNDLANALSMLGRHENTTICLEEAAATYRLALEELLRERAPLEWAMVQNNLANVLTDLGEREGKVAYLKEAAAAYRRALEEYTRERAPLDWAMTQNNLGTALLTLSRYENGNALLEEAIAAFRQALEEYTRERVPLSWAAIQNNLGNALLELDRKGSQPSRLEEAITAYCQALGETTRERARLDWAMTQNNLGNALQTLGKRETGTKRLKEATFAYRKALEERTRERTPLSWAETKINLAGALLALGRRESGTVNLEAALGAYRQASQEYSYERFPLDWASIQRGFAFTCDALFDKTHTLDWLDQALAAARSALEGYEKADASHDIEMCCHFIAYLEAKRNF